MKDNRTSYSPGPLAAIRLVAREDRDKHTHDQGEYDHACENQDQAREKRGGVHGFVAVLVFLTETSFSSSGVAKRYEGPSARAG